MITATALETRLYDMVAPSLNAMGYTIVQLRLMDGKANKTLQCLMERGDGVGMTVDDCQSISHTISALLDVEDPIPTAYHLEVSSSGLERPLTRLEDFTRFAGYDVQIEMVLPINGRKRFRGVIKGEAEEVVTIESDGKIYELPFPQMKQVKLLATDALIQRLLASDHSTQKKEKKTKKSAKKQKKDHKKRKAG